ncbi:MAG: hypothetical protein JWO05_1147 [Gemmatimonadetes bacterium]|nr:hypothetical protein [Gemmatimonadota bacterium]
MQISQELREASLPVATLLERIATVEHDLLFRKLATPDALAQHEPGGTENPDTSTRGVLVYLGHLERTHALALAGRGSAGASVAAAAGDAGEDLDAVLAAALEEQPELLPLDGGEVCSVYPKSLHALRTLDMLDVILGHVAAEMRTLEALADIEGVTPEIRKARALAPVTESLAVRLWCWILTHEGPGLPYRDSEADPQPPEWTTRITPDDLLRLSQAHQRVNARRVRLLAGLLPPDPAAAGRSALSLQAFAGAFAHERGLSPRRVMRRWSLGSLFGASVTAAKAQRDAKERAEREAKK